MRFISPTILLLLLSISLYAQPWLKNLPQGKSPGNLTFFDYQEAFESYWAPFNVVKGFYVENGVTKKASGWKQFKRWEYEMQSCIDKTTGAFPQKTPLQVTDEFFRNHPENKSPTSANWTPLGPNASGGGYSGIGRISCIAFHPTNLNTYWVGAGSGGLWMTNDNGNSWTCLTDQNEVLAVSDIIIPSDYEISRTIYIATGDRDHWINRSVGVLKSTDGGQTWNTTGLTFSIFNGQMVNRLLIDPNNNQILIAATTAGVFKTNDGGASWNIQLTPVEFIDMEYRPGNFNVLYGSTKSGDIYKSNDGISFGAPVFSDNEAHRIELAISPNQPDWVYAVAVNDEGGLYGIYKSINTGTSFDLVFSGSPINLLTWRADGNKTDGQGWYDLSLAVSPSNANTILVGGINTWRSNDGGANWSIVNHWTGDNAQTVHADKHALIYRSNGDVFECNDGGVYLSHNNGTFWIDKTDGIEISQMYRLGVSQTESREIITGLQDNGTKLLSANLWRDVKGADGMECLIDYTNKNIQYGSIYNGDLYRTMDHWQSSTYVSPSTAGDGAWITPYVIDPIDPNILYAGYREVWQTFDRGDNWNKISSFNIQDEIESMAVATSDPRHLYIAYLSSIWKTSNSGEDWTDITNNLPVGTADIEYITVKYNDPNTIWVVMSGYSSPGVYQSIDGGITWNNISGGLPSIPAYSLVQNVQALEVQLYVGTDLGVYFKKGGNEWIPFNTGLPNVRTGEIEIYYAPDPQDSKLRVATYGRGLWESPIEYSSVPMTFISSTTTQKNTSSAAPNQPNQELLKIEINTNGNLAPLPATSFTFNTDGCTNPGTDITNAKLFYSGTDNDFSTSTQFGNTIISPNGEFTIEGMQTLSDGKNNFWLTYDVSAGAILGNELDAECTSLTVDTPRTPVVTDPEGNRDISPIYCTAGAIETTYEYISNVRMGAVNQSSSKGIDGYQDFTSNIIDMYIGKSKPISIENGVPYEYDEVIIWVDWNIDGEFDDIDEAVYVSGPDDANIYYAEFAPPASAKQGITRMRIRLHDTQHGPNSTPCGIAQWGEVEDYSIRVSELNACTVINYFEYNAQNIVGQYVSLGSQGSVISTSDFDDANSAPQEIGFPFVFKCNPFTQFILNTNGFIKLGDTPPSAPDLFFDHPQQNQGGIFWSNDPADVNLIAPFNMDLTSGTGTAEYRVHTSGAAPYRVCTIQYQNVREKTTYPAPQYDNMQFQIKLYETTNIIEFVYGDWTTSSNQSGVMIASCGLKGSDYADEQLLIVTKGSGQPWNEAHFNNLNYYSTSPFYFGKPPDKPKPDAGRTFRFVPRYDHDLSAREIYALGDASIYHSNPQTIAVNIGNAGYNDLTDIPVTLTITGANTYSDTKYISTLGRDQYVDVVFTDIIPLANGLTSIEVSLPNDENNENNIIAWQQNTNEFYCNHSSSAGPEKGLGLTPTHARNYYAKYHVTGTADIKAVTAYIYDDTASIGKTVYGIIRSRDGIIVGLSDPYVLQANDLGKWNTFLIVVPPSISDADFYAGIALEASPVVTYTLGVQNENPQRSGTYFRSSIDGTLFMPFDLPNRLMIGAVLYPTAPVAGEPSFDIATCAGNSATLYLNGHTGNIQWQESPDGISNWVNVSTGVGYNTTEYITPPLYELIYYRVEITQPLFAPVYSGVVPVIVFDQPSSPIIEQIIHPTCTDPKGSIVVEGLPPTGEWTLAQLPGGEIFVLTGHSVMITDVEPGAYSFYYIDEFGCISDTSSTIIINPPPPIPVTPVITNTENILHSDATTGNQWYDQDGPIPGAVFQDFTTTITGDYYVIVTLDGCSSSPSNIIQVIISHIEDINKSHLILTYPNPVSDKLTIERPGQTQTIPFEIIDALGRVVYKDVLAEKSEVHTQDFAKGVYFIRFKVDPLVQMRKFVKE